MAPLPETYSGSQGLALLTGLDAMGKLVFTSADAMAAGRKKALGSRQVGHVLQRLVAAGWIRRIKQGLYAVTGKLPGSVAAHDFSIATAIHTPSALSHATALNLHGLSEQVPRVITCTTTAKVVTPSMRRGDGSSKRRGAEWNIEGLRIRFVSVVPSRFFGIEDVWIDTRTRVPVTDKERTVLDLFVDPRGTGDIGHAIGVVEEHLGRLDAPKLVSYAVRLGVSTIGRRLGWALESCGVSGDVLDPLLAMPLREVQPLDPAGPRRGSLIGRWRLRDNLPKAIR